MAAPDAPDPGAVPAEPDLLADEAVDVVVGWLRAAPTAETRADRRSARRLHRLVDDPRGVAFTMHFVDRVIRPDDDAVAAGQLHRLAAGRAPLPAFLSPVDRLLLRAGATLAPRLPRLVMPLARRRMRQIVGHLVVDAHGAAMDRHLGSRRDEGFTLNVNLLGEAVLGEREAARRLQATIDLLGDEHVDYVSVKISGVASQLQHWAWDDSVARIADRLRTILRAAQDRDTFVNLDMEEYHDLELTMAAFRTVLDEDEFLRTEAGIVLQAYLPDALGALTRLVGWATARQERGGADIKIRLVKGANLAMERVDAAMHGWEQAPYPTKADTDASYKRCLDWALQPERLRAVRIGVGSHNLFDVAWAALLARRRGVEDRVGIEMLEGMAPAQSRVVLGELGSLLLYTPVVDPQDFDVAISYLFRRLEENAAVGNFMRALGDLEPGSAPFVEQTADFRRAVAHRLDVATEPRRCLDRSTAPEPLGLAPFANEPESDPAVAGTRAWAVEHLARRPDPVRTPTVADAGEVDDIIRRARRAQADWWARPAAARRAVLRAVGDELARRRGDLLTVMAHEGRKTVAQADPEICEAIDFARYYADRTDLADPTGLGREHARFEPLGVVAVVPPWNFPVAIPAGGMFAALAAGSAVLAKPAPEVPRCSELVVEIAHAAGVPPDLLQYVPVPEDDVGRHLAHQRRRRGAHRRHRHRRAVRVVGPVHAAVRGDVGQERHRRHPQRRPRPGRGRPGGVGVRPRRPEVLGGEPRHLRRRRPRQPAVPSPARRRRGEPRRRPGAPPHHHDGTAHRTAQPAAGQGVPGARSPARSGSSSPGPSTKPGSCGRPASGRACGADRGSTAPSASARCSGWCGHGTWRRPSPSRTTRRSASPAGSTRSTRPRSTAGWTPSRSATPT